jgi:hypothetical protein
VIEGMYFLLFIMNGGDDDDDDDKLVVLTICLYSCVCFAVSCNSGDDTVFHIHTCQFSSSIFTQSCHYTRLTSPADSKNVCVIPPNFFMKQIKETVVWNLIKGMYIYFVMQILIDHSPNKDIVLF